MASGMPVLYPFLFYLIKTYGSGLQATAKIPKPTAEAGDAVPLPQTLVRIPTEHAPALQAHAEGAVEEESG